jgi:hypothetical protein
VATATAYLTLIAGASKCAEALGECVSKHPPETRENSSLVSVMYVSVIYSNSGGLPDFQ